MKKAALLSLFILLCTGAISEETNVNVKLAEYKQRIDNLESLLKQTESKFNALNDSLNRELTQYKAKEDYYFSSLSEQTGIFAAIVTIVIALGGLFTWRGFRYEIEKRTEIIEKIRNDLKNDLKRQDSKFDEHTLKFHELYRSIKQALFENHLVFGSDSFKDKQWKSVFNLNLLAAQDYAEIILNALEFDVNYKRFKYDAHQLFTFLYPVLNALNELSKDEKNKEILKKDIVHTYMRFDIINKIQDSEVRDRLSEIRYKFSEFIKADPK